MNPTQEQTAISSMHKAISLVVKCAELLGRGPSTVERKGTTLKVGWFPSEHTKEPLLWLCFEALPENEAGNVVKTYELIADSLTPPSKFELKTKIKALFDWGAMKELEYRGFEE